MQSRPFFMLGFSALRLLIAVYLQGTHNMECSSVITSLHAFKRMIQRSISPADVKAVINQGEIINRYPDDQPFPSVLMLRTIDKRPIHVVVGKNDESGECIIITVYVAGEEYWESDFKTKKE